MCDYICVRLIKVSNRKSWKVGNGSQAMTVNEIYNRIPKHIQTWNAFRKADRVEIEKVVFATTLANEMGVDADLIQDNGKRYVIFAA